MTRCLAILLLAVAALAPDTRAVAQTSSQGEAKRAARPSATPHQDELDCGNCHVGKHRGVVQMWVGMGGRGTPMIPSHMFQVRVECIACHTAPTSDDDTAVFTGQTFRPSEQACLACHGDRYRGMLEQWTTTLGRMRDVIGPKVDAARLALAAADPKNPKKARVAKLVEDAAFNARFVALAKGIHNVFYAADLLKLSNGWLDEAMALLGKAPPKADDQLVRGGYCAVLCHQAAGVKPLETVAFEKQKLPHVRHVTELGATCTSCHSAETHKAVTATRATCAGCHHGALNERCESCHRLQNDFYRGQLKTPLASISPNLMAEVVPCTGCHDWSQKPSRQAIGQRCVTCHEPPYLALLGEWTTGFAGDIKKTADAIRSAEVTLARARRGGRSVSDASAFLRQARETLAIVRRAGVAHNPLAADALLAAARHRADEVRGRFSGHGAMKDSRLGAKPEERPGALGSHALMKMH